MARPLNPKQLKFIDRYLATGNATQSYIDAGYTGRGRSAESGASEILRNPVVQDAIEKARGKAVEAFPLTYEGALANMWEQARWYGDDASHMARVRATEKVMEHFRPPAITPGVTVNVHSADELRDRLERLRARLLARGGGAVGEPAGGTGRVLPVAPEPPAAVQLAVGSPQGDSSQAAEGYGR